MCIKHTYVYNFTFVFMCIYMYIYMYICIYVLRAHTHTHVMTSTSCDGKLQAVLCGRKAWTQPSAVSLSIYSIVRGISVWFSVAFLGKIWGTLVAFFAIFRGFLQAKTGSCFVAHSGQFFKRNVVSLCKLQIPSFCLKSAFLKSPKLPQKRHNKFPKFCLKTPQKSLNPLFFPKSFLMPTKSKIAPDFPISP